MSEHAWAQENVAAYVAGGLDAEEGQRIERHIGECAECAAALGDCRGMDRSLETLFADARPAAGLEERTVTALRKASLSPWARMSWGQKLAWGTAATVALGLTGAGASYFLSVSELSLTKLTDMGIFIEARQRAIPDRADDKRPIFGMPVDPHNENYTKPEKEKNLLDPEAMAGQINGEAGNSGRLAVMALDDTKSLNLEGGATRLKSHVWGEMYRENNSRIKNDFVPFYPNSLFFGTTFQNAGGNNNGQHGQGGGLGGGGLGGGAGGQGGLNGGGLGGLGGGGMMPGGGANPQSAKGAGKGTPNGSMPYKAEDKKERFEPQLTTGQFQPGQHLNEFWMDQPGKDGTSPQSKSHFQPADHRAKADQQSEDKEDGGKNKEVSDGQGKARAPQPGSSGVTASGPGTVDPKPTPPAPEQAAPRRIIIRSGDIEFEIESFDVAVATVTKLVMGIKGGFVSTVNSDKLPNGKVRGSMVVRVPPESLDGFVLDLRRELGKGGELKGLKIGSQDITKQYTDLESRLKAAKTMQERLLQIIKDGKGEIKQLLEAEKELGVWRTKIEELEGEIRYYSNLAALSTLTITLAEKEIRAAVELVEREQVQAGVEVEDVDKAREEVLTGVADAKGRVVKAELKQHSVGQFNATLNFEVPPAAAGPLRDRLRQIGTVVRLDIDRVQQAEGGQATRDAKVRKGDAIFLVQLYNVTNMAARETTTVQLAVADVPKSYQALQQTVEKAKGRTVTGQLNENDRQNITAQLDFEVRRGQEAALQTALAAAGEIVARQTTRAVASENTTDAKVAYRATLSAIAKIPPREVVTLGIEVKDVDRELDNIRAMVNEAKGRTVDSVVGHERSGKVTARVLYDVPLAAAPELVEKLKRLGDVRAQQSIRNQQAPEGNFAIARLDVTLSNQELIVPKDEGLWSQVRGGLSISVRGLLVSLSWLIVGLCVVLPWGLVAYGVYRMARRLFRTAPAS